MGGRGCQRVTHRRTAEIAARLSLAVVTGRWAAVGPRELSTWNGPRAAHHEPLFGEVWFRRYQSCRPGCRIPPRWTGAPVPRSPRPALRRGRVMAGTDRSMGAGQGQEDKFFAGGGMVQTSGGRRLSGAGDKAAGNYSCAQCRYASRTYLQLRWGGDGRGGKGGRKRMGEGGTWERAGRQEEQGTWQGGGGRRWGAARAGTQRAALAWGR